MATTAQDATRWQAFDDIIKRLVGPDSINLLSSGTAIERMCIGFAQGSDEQRLNTADGFTARHLVSLLPDLLHLCAIKPTRDANDNVILGFESIKETSVLTLARHFLDSLAFFDIDKYALSFLTNLLLVLDKHDNGKGVATVHGNRFYTMLVQTGFEKIVRLRFYMLMQPKHGISDVETEKMKAEIEQLKNGLEKTDCYAQKQFYLGLLEMLKANNSAKTQSIIEGVLETGNIEGALKTETDIFAQAALVRLVPYMKPQYDKDKLSPLWNELNFQSKLALVLECTELQNVDKGIAQAVRELALQPFSLTDKERKFTSKLLTRLASKIPSKEVPTQSNHKELWDVTEDLENDDKPYTTRVALFRQSISRPVSTFEDFSEQIKWLRSPVYLIRMEAANHLSEFAKEKFRKVALVHNKVSQLEQDLANLPYVGEKKNSISKEVKDRIRTICEEIQKRVDSINMTEWCPVRLPKVIKSINNELKRLPTLCKPKYDETALKNRVEKLKEAVEKSLPVAQELDRCYDFYRLKRIIMPEYEIGNTGTRHAILMLVSLMINTDDHNGKAMSEWGNTGEHMRQAMQGNSEVMGKTTEILPTSPLGQYWMSFEVRHACLHPIGTASNTDSRW